MKGIPALLTETSKLDANEGIRFRGYSLPELQEKLPKLDAAGEPLPEGLFYLMMIGEIPEKEDVINISKDWATRAHVPQHVFDVIDALPKNSRPMTQFSTAILSMAYDSVFQKAYRAGVKPGDVILEIDGVACATSDVESISKKLRGKEGTSVTLTVERAHKSEPIQIKIVRARIEVESVLGDRRRMDGPINRCWHRSLSSYF